MLTSCPIPVNFTFDIPKTSVGLILLCALGNLHVSWTIWKLYMYFYDYQQLETEILLVWYIGAAAGGLFGTILNSSCSKILIYVRMIVIIISSRYIFSQHFTLFYVIFQYSIAVALIPVSVCFVLNQTFSYNLLLIGRGTAGVLYGVTLVTLILHIADNSSQFMRRHFMWTITAINLLPSVLLAETISTDVNASIGVIMFALAIFTLIFMPCTYESIVFLLKNGTDLRALEIMLKLRNESRHYIRRDFNEFKMMLVEDYSDGGNIFSNGNIRPLFLVLLLRLLNVLLTNSCIYWIFLANVWFDYQHWMSSKSISNQIRLVQDVYENVTAPDNTTENLVFDRDFNSTNFFNETFSENDNDIANTTDYDRATTTEPDIPTTNNSFSILNHLFVHSAYSYRLPPLEIVQFVLIVSLVKILVGVPFLCLAEKFQVYRNRVIFKVVLCIGIINLIFFMATLVCNLYDDSLLFTFYIAKLLSVIYGFYLLVAFSVDTIGHSELSESFSLFKRYGCTAFIVICEHLSYAIAILLVVNALYPFYFHLVQSVAICFICYLLLRWMPNECLNCTLREARDKHFVKMATANN